MEFIPQTTPLLLAGAFVFGTLIGSFLNVVIIRLPQSLEYDWRLQCRELLGCEKDESEVLPPSIANGRSKCPNCNHKIRIWENIPVLSFMFLHGKCSNCKQKISIRYPIVELTTGILFLVVIWQLGPSLQGMTALLLTSFLIALTGIDFDHQLLPDNLTLPLLWGGIIVSNWSIHCELQSSVLGAVFGYLSLWTIYQVFRILTGKEGMGYGDFKLLAALGAWLGWQSLPLIIFLSSIVGAIVGILLILLKKMDRENPIPFGPYISAAGWITLVWGSDLTGKYLGLSQFG